MKMLGKQLAIMIKKIAEVWKDKCQSSGLAGVAKTLKDMQGELANWGKSNLGNFKEKLAKLRQELGRARMKSVGRGPSQEEKNIMGWINRVLHQEEIWIKQRARIQWLRAGDRNSAFFHAQVAQQKRMNKILSLQRSDGTMCERVEDVHAKIQGFYQHLYQS
jgi:hypothetical protein